MSADETSRRRNRRHTPWLAGAAGLTTVATIAGVTAARSISRRSITDDPYAAEDFETLYDDRRYVLTTPDGVPLAVREVGQVDAPLTVVFAHGFCLRMEAFHFQCGRLSEEWGPNVRMVLGDRIVGAALISSAAEGVARSPLGEVLKNPALQAVRFTLRSAPKLAHRGRNIARSLIGPILRAASYGDSNVSPAVVAFSHEMMNETPIPTLVEFLQALEVHDETAALPTLAKIPTLIACGDHDLVTPHEYSRKMSTAMPQSELLIVEKAGHLALLGKPDAINDALVRLVRRVAPGKQADWRRRWRERLRHRA